MRPREAVSRRRFLLSSLCAGGAGSRWATFCVCVRTRPSRGVRRRDTSVIQVWLGGGPSQFETFDPKPQAAAEIRGPYKAIRSRLPGVAVCETLPLTAAVLDRAANRPQFHACVRRSLWRHTVVPRRSPRA